MNKSYEQVKELIINSYYTYLNVIKKEALKSTNLENKGILLLYHFDKHSASYLAASKKDASILNQLKEKNLSKMKEPIDIQNMGEINLEELVPLLNSSIDSAEKLKESEDYETIFCYKKYYALVRNFVVNNEGEYRGDTEMFILLFISKNPDDDIKKMDKLRDFFKFVIQVYFNLFIKSKAFQNDYGINEETVSSFYDHLNKKFKNDELTDDEILNFFYFNKIKI